MLEAVVRSGMARFEFRHFIVFDDGASLYAAELTECAADQGAFWEFHDRLLAPDERMYEWEAAAALADSLGLDVGRLRECVANHEHLRAIEAGHVGGLELGVRGTPSVTVDGVLVEELSAANVIAAVEAAVGE